MFLNRVAVAATLLFVQPLWAAQPADDAKAALKSIAGFGEVAVDALVPDGSAFKVKLAGADSAVSLYVIAGPDKTWHAAVLPTAGLRWSGADAWPEFGADAFGDAVLSPRGLIVSTGTAKLDNRKWPKALSAAFAGDSLEVGSGVNAFIDITPGSGGALSQVKTAIGFNKGTVRLTGRAGPGLLKKLMPKSGDAASVPVELSVAFPAATPPAFQGVAATAPFRVTFPSTIISIKGQKGGAVISGKQSVEVRIVEKSLTLDNELSFSKSGQTWAIACKGSLNAEQDPFGLDAVGFVVKKYTLAGDLAGTSGSGPKVTGFGLAVGAEVAVAGVGVLQGDFSVDIVQNQVTELALNLRGLGKDGINVGRLGHLKNLPGAADFSFLQLSIGVNTLSKQFFLFGDLAWPKKQIRASAALLIGAGEGAKEFALFLKAQGLTLRKLSEAFPAEVDVVALDNVLLVISTAQLKNMAPAMIPGPVKAMMKEIGADTEGHLSFMDGVTLITAFTPGDEAALLGLSKKPIVLAGGVGGVFKGDPSLSLYADLGAFTPPKGSQPGFIKAKSVSPKFFLVARDLKKAPAMDIGVEVDSMVLLGHDSVEMGLRTYATLGKSGAGVRITGLMRGDWKNPLGLQTLVLSDTVLGFGVSADGSAGVSMGGMLTIDKDRFDSQNTLGLSPVGGIRYLGMAFKADVLTPETPLKLMDIFIRSAAAGPMADALNETDRKRLQLLAKGPTLLETAKKTIPLDVVVVKGAQAYLATPGTPSDPDLPAIKGMGIGLAGTLMIEGKPASHLISYVTEAEGMRLAGDLADLEVGPLLSLKGAKIDVNVPMPLQGIPSFLLKGKAKVLVSENQLDVEVGIAKLKFVTKNDWGAFGHADFHAESMGKDLLHPTDFILEMEGGADIKNGIRKELVPAMTKLLEEAGASEQQALAKARQDLVPLKKNLAEVRESAAKNKKSAESVINSAKKDVDKWNDKLDDVDDDIDDKKDDIEDAKDDAAKWPKLPKLEAELIALRAKKVGVKASYAVAKEALKAAKGATKVVPIDAYPEVVAAQAPVSEKEAEIQSLEASTAANTAMSQVVKDIKEGAKSIPLTLDEVSFKDGSMAKALQGRPQKLRVKGRIEMPGKKPVELDHTLRINLMNPTAMDLTSLAKAVQDALKALHDVSPPEEARERRSRRKK